MTTSLRVPGASAGTVNHGARRRGQPDAATPTITVPPLGNPGAAMVATVPPEEGPEPGESFEMSSCGSPTPTSPSWSLRNSVNQRSLAGPAVMPYGPETGGEDEELGDDAGGRDAADPVAVELGEPEVAVGAGGDAEDAGRVGRGNSVMVPSVAMRPILWPLFSTNQRLPSGPSVMPSGEAAAVGTGNSVKTPAGVMRPILFLPCSVNQRLPSGPEVMNWASRWRWGWGTR